MDQEPYPAGTVPTVEFDLPVLADALLRIFFQASLLLRQRFETVPLLSIRLLLVFHHSRFLLPDSRSCSDLGILP